MRPPRSTHCPRCGFSFAWNGRKCSHCPPPARARLLWEQIGRFPELVGSDEGITQRRLLMIAPGACAVWRLLPESARERSIDSARPGRCGEWAGSYSTVRTEDRNSLEACESPGSSETLLSTLRYNHRRPLLVCAFSGRDLLSFPFPPGRRRAVSLLTRSRG